MSATTDRKLDLKNPWIAGLLAWLIPGAGHVYQRRFFKAGVYSICILGTMLYGMALGEWRTVHWTEIKGGRREKNWGFLTQIGVGSTGLFAYSQTRKFESPKNRPALINAFGLSQELNIPGHIDADTLPNIVLNESIEAPFQGELNGREELPSGKLDGRIQIEPQNQSFKGTFVGTVTTNEGKTREIKLVLGESLFLDRKTLGAPERRLVARIIDEEDRTAIGSIDGNVPRGFMSWFAAPLDDVELTKIHLRLNKQYEIALVFTWIAGLLNVLAVWDAVQGPAYGWGDEPPPEKDSKKKKKAAAAESTGDENTSSPDPVANRSNGEAAKEDSKTAAPVAGEK